MSAIILHAISVASAVMALDCLLVTDWRRSLVYRQAEMKRAKWKSLNGGLAIFGGETVVRFDGQEAECRVEIVKGKREERRLTKRLRPSKRPRRSPLLCAV